MILYHGGSIAVEIPKIRDRIYNKDFGRGFYYTKFQLQAERWAKSFQTPIVSIFEYNHDASLNTLTFG